MFKWYFDPCKCNNNPDLLDLLRTLEEKLDALKEEIGNVPRNQKLATRAVTQVKFQYLMYMNLYGYPPNGEWNPTLLDEIYEKYKDLG